MTSASIWPARSRRSAGAVRQAAAGLASGRLLSIYKRDWNVEGFAPSVSVTATRNSSTLPLYDERRLRDEVRLTKAF
jgi:hypothetical protein